MKKTNQNRKESFFGRVEIKKMKIGKREIIIN